MGASSESGTASKSNRCCWNSIIIGVFTTVSVVAIVMVCTYDSGNGKTPIYSATITAVSGLDPETDLRRQSPLSPVFNITVGVASHNRVHGASIAPGTSVKVSYGYSDLSLPMASGHVPEVSVAHGESRDLPSVVASGRDVAVPGFLMDSLVEEMMRTGRAMFEVKLVESHEYGWGDRAEGWGRVGDTITLRSPF